MDDFDDFVFSPRAAEYGDEQQQVPDQQQLVEVVQTAPAVQPITQSDVVLNAQSEGCVLIPTDNPLQYTYDTTLL